MCQFNAMEKDPLLSPMCQTAYNCNGRSCCPDKNQIAPENTNFISMNDIAVLNLERSGFFTVRRKIEGLQMLVLPKRQLFMEKEGTKEPNDVI